MKRSAVVGIQFKPDGLNLEAAVTTVPYSLNWDTKTAHSKGRGAACRGKSDGISRDHLVVANLLPRVEIDIEVEELEEKKAPQSDTSYLDWMSGGEDPSAPSS